MINQGAIDIAKKIFIDDDVGVKENQMIGGRLFGSQISLVGDISLAGIYDVKV